MAPNDEFTPETVDEQIEHLSRVPPQQTHPAERGDASLVQALRRIYHVPLSEADRSSLGRARQRIVDGRTSDKTLDHENTLQGQRDGSGFLQRNAEQRKRSTIVRVLSSLAAVIIVGALVGSWVLVTHLAVHHQTTQTEPTAPTMKAVEPLTAIDMLDQHQGWALTSTSILRTSDGGIHWKDVSPANVHHLSGLQGTFLTVSTAWVAADMSESEPLGVLRTTDGGNHWDSVSLPQSNGRFLMGGPDFINPSDGWLEVRTQGATGNEGVDIYRTADGGKTWGKVSSTTFQTGKAPGHLPWFGIKSGISFLTTQTGWATVSEAPPDVSWLYVTHDGGITWQPQHLTWPKGVTEYPEAIPIPPLFFGKDGLLPILINHATVLYVTHDGGTSWQSTAFGPWTDMLDALDVNHILGIDTSGLAVTSDGGYHWKQITPNVDFTNVSVLDFISSRVGWAIGGRESPQPLLLKTTDGGHTWTEIAYSIS